MHLFENLIFLVFLHFLFYYYHHVGPQPDWDPDIVEALDDDFDLDNPDNLLEDDFVLQANKPLDSGEE